MNYSKYLKYKKKYLELKGGMVPLDKTDIKELPSCLVVCSYINGKGIDFNIFKDKLSEILETQIDYENINVLDQKSPRSFPGDLDLTKKYDIIWFSGCNLLTWIFGERSGERAGVPINYLELEHFHNLLTILKDNGKIIFTEEGKLNQIKEYPQLQDNINNVSVSIEHMYNRSALKFPDEPVIPDFMSQWNTYFIKIMIKDHIFYIKK